MKKAVLYLRYSSNNQTEQSIEGQRHVCEQYADRNDIEIVGEYADRAISGTTDRRPQFRRMMADAGKGEWDIVLVYKLDRFARSRYDSLMYKRSLKECGVRVVSATEPLTDEPMGVIMESLIEGMDEYYSIELAQKTRRGRLESIRKGAYISGCPPYGYAAQNKHLVIREPQASVAREMFERYAAGDKIGTITNDLNARGILNSCGNPWRHDNISRILRSRTYAGHYIIGDLGEIACPPIVSEDLFDIVQKLLDESRHRCRKVRSEFTYFLTGKLVCDVCGEHMSGLTVRARGRKYRYYYCRNKCGHLARADHLHERVKALLAEYLTPEHVDEIAAAAWEEYQKEQQPDESEILRAELASTEKAIQNAVKAILQGVESQALSDTMKELESRRDALERKIKAYDAAKPEMTEEKLRAALSTLAEQAQTAEGFGRLADIAVTRVIHTDDADVICTNLTGRDVSEPKVLSEVGALGRQGKV